MRKIIGVILSICFMCFPFVNIKLKPQSTNISILSFQDLKNTYPQYAEEIKPYRDYFLDAVSIAKENVHIDDEYRVNNNQFTWSLYANLGVMKGWKCYSELKSGDEIVMTTSYIDFTSPERVSYSSLDLMANVMEYDVVKVRRWYQEFLDAYQNEGKVKKEIVIDGHGTIVFAYMKSPNGNSLMIDMTKKIHL